jgi:thioredoxin 1
MERLVLVVLLGATIGFGIGYMGSRAGGACPIMCNPYIAAAFGAVVGALLAGGMGSRVPEYTPSPHLREIKSEEAFRQEVLEAEGLVLVDFSSPGCPWCVKLEPVIHSIADRYAGRVRVAYVNVRDVPGAQRTFDLGGYPTLMLFRDGQQVAKEMGYRPESDVAALVEGQLQTALP